MVSGLQNNPKRIFLLDGIGAIISILMLGIVLVNLEPYFGIPKNVLYILATLPIFFLIYDLYCYCRQIVNKCSIRIIALTNLLYCFLSLVLTILHFSKITILGWLYIIIEIIIVVVVAIIELKLSAEIINTRISNE